MLNCYISYAVTLLFDCLGRSVQEGLGYSYPKGKLSFNLWNYV